MPTEHESIKIKSFSAAKIYIFTYAFNICLKKRNVAQIKSKI